MKNNRLRVVKLINKAVKLQSKETKIADQITEINTEVYSLVGKIIKEEVLFKGSEWKLHVRSSGTFYLEYIPPNKSTDSLIAPLLDLLSIKTDQNGHLVESLMTDGDYSYFEVFPGVMLELDGSHLILSFNDNQTSNKNAVDLINSLEITITIGTLKEDIHFQQRKTNILQKMLHVYGTKV